MPTSALQISSTEMRFEFSVGHGISTNALMEGDACREVRSTWIPVAAVEKVVPTSIAGVELAMEKLAAVQTVADAKIALGAFGSEYGAWIVRQRATAPIEDRRAEVAKDLLRPLRPCPATDRAGTRRA